jgi:serine O-acetyltransferase
MKLEDRGRDLWRTFTADMQRYAGSDIRPWSARFLRRLIAASYEHPALWAVVVYRYGQWVLYRCRLPILRQIANIHYYLCFNWIRTRLQVEVPRTTAIDAGFRIDHMGSCLVNCQVIAGRNFTITFGVVIGQSDTGIPVIGDNVSVGVGAKVIGGIHVGDDVVIGAQSVVVKDVPNGAVVAGVPAKVLRIRDPRFRTVGDTAA